jgi:hypothetical protein
MLRPTISVRLIFWLCEFFILFFKKQIIIKKIQDIAAGLPNLEKNSF